MKKNQLTIAFGLILVIAIALLVYQFVFRDSPNIRLPVAEACLLNLKSCTSEFPGGGKIQFEIHPKQPNPAEVLYLSATFQQVEPAAVRVSFKGESMNMGYLEYVKYELRRKDTNDGSILFSGKGGLSVCISGLMKWVVLVDVQVGEAIYEVPFKFETTYTFNNT